MSGQNPRFWLRSLWENLVTSYYHGRVLAGSDQSERPRTIIGAADAGLHRPAPAETIMK